MSRKIRKAAGIGGIILLLVCGVLFFKVGNGKLPFRFYHVLTDSMEPTIKTDSLVFVKAYHEGMNLEEGDIITFRAKRFGEDIVITHRFAHTEMTEEGKVIYRTHPEQSTLLDPYETTQEDLLGVYIVHIPYLGRLMSFFKSAFGLLWLCETMVILLVRQMLLARWKEKETIAAEC